MPSVLILFVAAVAGAVIVGLALGQAHATYRIRGPFRCGPRLQRLIHRAMRRIRR